MIIGCDFHPRFQQIAYVDLETGEFFERRLNHPEEAERFYRSLAGTQVRIGLEATGNFRWFRQLIDELGYEFLLGHSSAIRASNPHRQKTDSGMPGTFCKCCWKSDFRQSGSHRRRTRKCGSYCCIVAAWFGCASGSRTSWTPWVRTRACWVPRVGLPSDAGTSRRCRCLAGIYAGTRLVRFAGRVGEAIEPLEKAVVEAAEKNQQACLLMTHPGVGPIVSLVYVLTIGDWKRFPRSRNWPATWA